MRRLIYNLLIWMFVLPLGLHADEGMWVPMFLDKLDLKKWQQKGLELTPDEIYSINHSSIKDAVPQFNGGCTSSFISSDGLILTNHHCGYDAIANHSTTENDILKDGFWAKSFSEELPNPGMKISLFISMEDVSVEIFSAISKQMDETKRDSLIRLQIKNQIIKANEKGKYRVEVKSFYNGNEYYLFKYQDFKDVRLVGTPPSSIGKFGGETDNWMWPRHTGDFSIFRVYADKDNNPAAYSPDNVPYKPKHFLPLYIGDKKEHDFSFIMGFPGTTQRYLTSREIDFRVKEEYPAFVKAREIKLDVLRPAIRADRDVLLKYTIDFERTSNYWKNRIGMIKALTKHNTAQAKLAEQEKLKEWINANKERSDKYGRIFEFFDQYYDSASKIVKAMQYYNQGLLQGSALVRTVRSLSSDENIPDSVFRHKKTDAYQKMNLAVEQEILRRMFKLVYEELPREQLPEEFVIAVEKYKGVDPLVDRIVNKSVFFSPEFGRLLPGKMDKDMLLKMVRSFIEKYDEISKREMSNRKKTQEVQRLYLSALREMNEDKLLYPDANLTMRVTFGEVLPYSPADAIFYDYRTTLEGVIEKSVPGDAEFDVSSKLIELNSIKNYGNYAAADGKVPVNFLTNHDITGGNSGSPVIDGKGRLVGLAFDGNWEAMSGDVEFDDKLQRTINVDIRYVLFIIDKYAGANHILDSLVLIR